MTVGNNFPGDYDGVLLLLLLSRLSFKVELLSNQLRDKVFTILMFIFREFKLECFALLFLILLMN